MIIADKASPVTLASDPGLHWKKDSRPAIEAPPDNDTSPLPEAVWKQDAPRTGICGTVTPRVVVLGAGFRMYYTQILPRPGFPAGANDYDSSTTRILSAYSADGFDWKPEPGVRISAQQGGAGEFRVVCGEVAPVPGQKKSRLRMYFEVCPGPQSLSSTIRSALSDDGLEWEMEPGDRMAAPGRSFVSPRIVFLEDGRCRLYGCERSRGIISAISDDGGLTFREEPGVRIAMGNEHDRVIAFAPEVVRLPGGGYRMYYAGYSASHRACILTATSADGLTWTKHSQPAIAPGGRWDEVKCSEMCIVPVKDRQGRPAHRIFYEACDGTAANQRGVWRVAGATATS